MTAPPQPQTFWRLLDYLEPSGQSLGLPCQLRSGGRSREDSTAYSWDGLRRGEQNVVIVQLTTGGFGALDWEDEAPRRLTAGQCFIVTVPHRHRYYLPADSSFWEFSYLCLTGPEALRLADMIIRQHGPVLDLSPIPALPARSLIEQALDEIAAGNLTSPWRASSMACRVIFALAEHALDQPGRAPVSSGQSSGNLATEARSYCLARLAQNLGVEDLARHFGLSVYHFSRRFRAETGLSPRRFMEELRLGEAMKRLRLNREKSVKEIAAQCGFADGNYFAKVFRRAKGMSPSGFRQRGW